jgi:hypothetical protein
MEFSFSSGTGQLQAVMPHAAEDGTLADRRLTPTGYPLAGVGARRPRAPRWVAVKRGNANREWYSMYPRTLSCNMAGNPGKSRISGTADTIRVKHFDPQNRTLFSQFTRPSSIA